MLVPLCSATIDGWPANDGAWSILRMSSLMVLRLTRVVVPCG
jgi:hypothetical protein